MSRPNRYAAHLRLRRLPGQTPGRRRKKGIPLLAVIADWFNRLRH